MKARQVTSRNTGNLVAFDELHQVILKKNMNYATGTRVFKSPWRKI
jgi:ribosomal protein L14